MIVIISEVDKMSEIKAVKLFTPEGGRVDGEAVFADYAGADRVGPYRVGRLAFYYRSGLKHICVPFERVDHVFKRAMLCASRTCGKVVHTDTFWLVLCSGADELCEAKTIDEKYADRALELMRERIEGASFGK